LFSESKRSDVTGATADVSSEKTMVGECKSLGGEGDVPSIAIERCATGDLNSQARLQVRLPDGSRKVITIKSSTSLAELYNTIRTEYVVSNLKIVYNLCRTGLRDFELRTPAPVSLIPEVADANVSHAGLMNSVLLVIMKK
jgi:hypothetical protein